MFTGGAALARRDAAPAVRLALEAAGTLYDWAARQPGHESFTGRGAAYGVALGTVRVVVRHARRGGLVAGLVKDRYLGQPRFLREIAMARLLTNAGVATPAVVAALRYPAGIGHRADVATERIDGRDLATIFFGDEPVTGDPRQLTLIEVGKAVRRMHDAGVVHPDLQLRNVLVSPGPLDPRLTTHDSRLTIWLLDVDTCRIVGKGDRAAHAANVARFARSWEKFNRTVGPRLTTEDREAFKAGYAESA